MSKSRLDDSSTIWKQHIESKTKFDKSRSPSGSMSNTKTSNMTFLQPAQKKAKPSKLEVFLGKNYQKNYDPLTTYKKSPKRAEEESGKAPTLVSYASKEDVLKFADQNSTKKGVKVANPSGAEIHLGKKFIKKLPSREKLSPVL